MGLNVVMNIFRDYKDKLPHLGLYQVSDRRRPLPRAFGVGLCKKNVKESKQSIANQLCPDYYDKPACVALAVVHVLTTRAVRVGLGSVGFQR